MATIRIIDVRDVTATTPERMGKSDKLIIYTVDNIRTYNISMPGEGFTPEKALEQIKAEETERLKLIGKVIDVKSGG